MCSSRGIGALLAALDPAELAFGDYSKGRWAWRLRDVRPLREPWPIRGALGLWAVSTTDRLAIEAREGDVLLDVGQRALRALREPFVK